MRISRHEDARLRAVDSGLPAALGARYVSAPVEFGGLLPEVPDVAIDVLGVPVEGVLSDAVVENEGVLDDHRAYAADYSPALRDAKDVSPALAVLGALVDQAGAGLKRKPRV